MTIDKDAMHRISQSQGEFEFEGEISKVFYLSWTQNALVSYCHDSPSLIVSCYLIGIVASPDDPN